MKTLLNFPKISGLILLTILSGFLYHIPNFTLDASADSLVLENDKDLLYYQKIQQQYQTQDSLIVTYTPKSNKLFSIKQLTHLTQLRDKLTKVEGVSSVTSILEVPLFQSPPISLTEVASTYISISTGNASLTLAEQEFQTNPFYRNNLISPDGKTTAILLTLATDIQAVNHSNKRNQLRLLKTKQSLSTKQSQELKQLEIKVSKNTTIATNKQKILIATIRAINTQFSDEANIFLGGLPIITTDVIAYIKNDLIVFSVGVILLMMLVLMLIFKKIRWVLMPISISLLAGLTMTGILGFLDWKVTVISANFFSLLLVMTLSVMIHLIVKYRELTQLSDPNSDKLILIEQTVRSMFRPCLFTTLTTVIAFVSLLISGIRPVIDFGWMMSIGVTLALVLAFISFIILMATLPKPSSTQHKTNFSFTTKLARLTDRYGKSLLAFMVGILMVSIIGITQLSVENRFIDYFKQHTEIHQGLSLIDQQLGGTTPLEVVIDDWGYDYWYDDHIRQQAHEIQTYLDSLDSVGKVLSIDVSLQLIALLNNGQTPGGFFLNIIRQQVPKQIKDQVIDPYLSEQTGQLRFVTRIKDTMVGLQRNELIKTIKTHLIQTMGIDSKFVHITGTMVLYNNMLQSLFQSQITTMGLVFVMIFMMFLIVFRSLLFSVLALIVNILPAFLVLGVMGLLGIPLDLMTITIAAIAIGIGVDNAIHYIHRFKTEFKQDKDYHKTMYRSHSSIGLAMFYTSLTVSLGFLVLTLSNFVPSIYFGIFTALAMMMALLSNLTLLPRLILWFKPKI